MQKRKKGKTVFVFWGGGEVVESQTIVNSPSFSFIWPTESPFSTESPSLDCFHANPNNKV